LTYGPGVASFDFTLYKDFKITESKLFQIKAEAFNVFNHFNPGAPNTLMNINFASGANTNNARNFSRTISSRGPPMENWDNLVFGVRSRSDCLSGTLSVTVLFKAYTQKQENKCHQS
jgi:hypothetical protein